jgi:hypothetical protein
MVESHLHTLSETKEVGEPDACRAGAWQRDCRLIGWAGSGVPHLLVAVIARCPGASSVSRYPRRKQGRSQFACLALAPAANVVMVTS